MNPVENAKMFWTESHQRSRVKNMKILVKMLEEQK